MKTKKNGNLINCAKRYACLGNGGLSNIRWERICRMIESTSFSVADIAVAIYVLSAVPEIGYNEICEDLEEAARQDRYEREEKDEENEQ